MTRKYERFKLKCGHEGYIVWRSNGTFGVKGSVQSCDVCYKRVKGRTPTVHILEISGKTQKRPQIRGLYGLDNVSKSETEVLTNKKGKWLASTSGEETHERNIRSHTR